MDELTKKQNLHDVFVYVDNVVICGTLKADHDVNLRWFQVAEKLDN